MPRTLGLRVSRGIWTSTNRSVDRTRTKNRRDPPWRVDHLQECREIHSTVRDTNTRGSFWSWGTEKCGFREDVPKLRGRKRDDGGVNPEDGAPAHDLHASIFEVKRLVASKYPFATRLFHIVA